MKHWEYGDETSEDVVRAGGSRVRAINPEAYLDPYVLLEAVRDEQARVTDFVVVAANSAAAETEFAQDVRLGSRLRDLLPTVVESGLYEAFIRVVESGEPLNLEDWQYPPELIDGRIAHYDVSGVRVGDGLGFAWWDVTRRYEKDRSAARAEEELRAILDSLLDPHAILKPVHGAAGRVVDWETQMVNAAACEWLGYSHDESIGRRMRQLWPAAPAAAIVGWADGVSESGVPLTLDDEPLPTPQGDPRFIDVRAVRTGDNVSFTWRDVTDRVMNARKTAQSREHYRLLAENASEMVFQTDEKRRIAWVSPSVAKVAGWAPEDLLGREMSSLIHPDDLESVQRRQRDLMAAGTLRGALELRLAMADGTWRWMNLVGQALVDDDGRIIGDVSALRDIQDQKDAQAALEASQDRFRRSMMDAAIGMAIVAPTGEFLQVNPAICQMLDRDEARLLTSTWQELTHPEDLHIDASLAQEVLDGTRDTYRLAKRYLRPDAEIVWADLTVSGVRDDHGRVLYFVSQIVDITSAVRAREALADSEYHYRLMAENASDLVFRASANGRVEWVSPSAADVVGWTAEELVGQPMMSFVLPEDLPESLQVKPDNRDHIDLVVRCRTADGSHRWFDVSSKPLVDESGRFVGRMGRLRDVQAEHEAQEALRRSEQRFRTAMESAPAGMAVVGLDRGFLEVNPALCRLLGRSEQWLLEHRVTDVLDPPDELVDRRLRAEVLAGAVASLSVDHQMVRSDGERLLVEQSIGLLRDEAGDPTGFVSQFVDVTEARESRERLRFLATHDSMTELFNRHELVSRISGVLEQTPRSGINVGVLFIDLDGLKPVNDSYGHAVGDEVIVTVARRIRAQVRSGDVLARFGGDEFVLVLPAIHNYEDAERIAASLHEAVEVPMVLDGNEITVTLSIGVAVVRPGEDPDVALSQADSALYEAKRAGRARTARYTPD